MDADVNIVDRHAGIAKRTSRKVATAYDDFHEASFARGGDVAYDERSPGAALDYCGIEGACSRCVQRGCAYSSTGVPTMSKRWICRMVRHRYVPVPLPNSGDDGGFLLRCARCAHEKPEPDRGPASNWGGGLGMSG